MAYDSPEEFKRKHLAKYLLAKKQLLLKLIFPVHTCALPLGYTPPKPTILRSIYYLLNDEEIVYIGLSRFVAKAVASHKSLGTITFNSYTIYQPTSASNGAVLLPYLIELNKPRHNDHSSDRLSFTIPNINELMKYIKTVKV